MLNRNCFLAAFLVVLAASAISAETGVQTIRVRDWITHYAVQAKITLQGPESLSVDTNDDGTVELSLPAGQYAEEDSAPGYKTMKGGLKVQAGNNPPLTVNLVSLRPREEEQWEASQLKPGYTLFRGYATDKQGHPLAGVRVRFKNAGVETTTNERGYYSFSVLTPPETARDHPGTDTLIAEKTGYKTIVHENVILAGEDAGGRALDMERGSGAVEIDDMPMAGCPTHSRVSNEWDSV